MSKNIHGTCGHCGGAVTTPSVWMGIEPPTPTCNRCGRIPKNPHGPVIPMEDSPRGRESSGLPEITDTQEYIPVIRRGGSSAGLLLLAVILCGCSSRLPNDRAAENNLRNPPAPKVARADPNYIAPEPARNDPNEPRYMYPPSVPYRGRQNVTDGVRHENEADAKTAEHYTGGAK